MKYFEAHTQIAAPPAKVWQILTDKTLQASDDFDITSLTGDLRFGGRLILVSALTPRAFKLRVTTFEPAQKMVWKGGLPFGLFTGIRHFSLSAIDSGTAFHMRENFSGLLLPLIGRALPDLTPSFTKFATALKHHSEALK